MRTSLANLLAIPIVDTHPNDGKAIVEFHSIIFTIVEDWTFEKTYCVLNWIELYEELFWFH